MYIRWKILIRGIGRQRCGVRWDRSQCYINTGHSNSRTDWVHYQPRQTVILHEPTGHHGDRYYSGLNWEKMHRTLNWNIQRKTFLFICCGSTIIFISIPKKNLELYDFLILWKCNLHKIWLHGKGEKHWVRRFFLFL